MQVLVGHPDLRVPDPCGRPEREVEVDVGVVVVLHGRDGHIVGGEPVDVVQRGPRRAGGEHVGCRSERLQRAVLGVHPREDRLAGELQRPGSDRERRPPVVLGLGRPPARAVALVVDDLLQDGVQRVRLERCLVRDGGAEGRRRVVGAVVERGVEQPVQGVDARAHAERHAEHLQAPHAEQLSGRQGDVPDGEPIGEAAQGVDVRGVQPRELAVARRLARVRAAVHLLGGRGRAGQAAGHVARGQRLGVCGQVHEGQEAAVRLAEGRPLPAAVDGRPQVFGVRDDRVATEAREVVGGHVGGGEPRDHPSIDARGPARPTLVEQDDAVGRGGGREPPAGHRPGALTARAALQEQQQGQVVGGTLRIDDLTGEDLDRPEPRGVRPVDRDLHPVLPHEQPGRPVLPRRRVCDPRHLAHRPTVGHLAGTS